MKHTQFTKDGKPFLSLGAQTHNSSSFQLPMERAYRSVKALGGNTIATPVSWQRFEPLEGQFDEAYVTGIIDDVRAQGLKLVILWFASWKNATMEYCPEWVICDSGRFPRVQLKGGEEVHVLSSHYEENRNADARAFCRLLEVIKRHDESRRTVIAVQIENEAAIGAFTRRDFSPAATAEFYAPVPAELTAQARATAGQLHDYWVEGGRREGADWPSTFGRFGAEALTAWSIARYIDYIAGQGRKVYDIFLYTNVALDGGLRGTGWDIAGLNFSAGGPTLRNRDIYYCACPHLDALAPDIYQTEFLRHYEAVDGYANPRQGWPLFVPESGCNALNANAVLYAVCEKEALGYHIFGAEHALDDDGRLTPEGEMISRSFHMAGAIAPLLLEHRGTPRAHSFAQRTGEDSFCLELEGWRCKVSFAGPGYSWNGMDFAHTAAREEEGAGMMDYTAEKGRGILIQVNEDEFYIVGHKARLAFQRYEDLDGSIPTVMLGAMAQNNYTEYLEITEGHFVDGQYVADVVRTGDESRQGLWLCSDCGVIHVRLRPAVG